MKNLDWCAYTYRHRRAFAYTADRLIQDPALKEEMQRRAHVHDMDKMLMYLFLDQKESQLRHIAMQPHHLENDLPKSYEDLVETVIDYECAPYTKPDKPLNAYDFMRKLTDAGLLEKGLADTLFGIMRELGIDRSRDLREDAGAMMYLSGFRDVSEEMILLEVLEYVREHEAAAEELMFLRERTESIGVSQIVISTDMCQDVE